ncbi:MULTISPECIES: GAP family protein [unclassified Streptomyces]|uniref:GAP family protein n=1 Tax=unclassified Streptomyces TaxID=2593676 RepID=UPI00225A18F7|nr:GAP family protein [Streptomyces sp. NBC_00340]MCX5134245.1 GAP family protein [Streptomyces sp. NBC_00340]
MGDAIGQMLPSAVGIAISPLPLVAVILMLATPQGRTNGIAFTVGWTLSLAGATAALVVLGSSGDATTGSGSPATWTSWLKLALGLVFILLAAKQFTGRPRDGREARQPGWMKAIDHFTPGRAAGLAAALAVVNPKNVVLLLGGALAIAASTAGTGGKAVAGVVMVLIASLCTTVPLAVYLLGGDRSAQTLNGWKGWMSAHNAAIMTTVLGILGAKYIGDAISALST